MAATKQSGLQYGTYYSGQGSGGKNAKNRFLVIGAIVALLIALAMLFSTITNNNAKTDLTLLAVRENSLLTVTTDAQANITNDDLRVANSNATILLTSDVTSLVTVTDVKKLSDGQVKQEADTNGDTLKQAKLLDKFDSVYQKLVIQKVTDLVIQAQTVQSKTSNKKYRAEVTKTLENLQSIQKQFEALSL